MAAFLGAFNALFLGLNLALYAHQPNPYSAAAAVFCGLAVAISATVLVTRSR